jgi:hypothetical protein
MSKMPPAAKFYKGLCEKYFFGASRQIIIWGCVKRFLPPAAAEYSFERHVIFTISRSEIVKMTCLSKHNLARSAEKNLLHNLNIKFCRRKRQKPF